MPSEAQGAAQIGSRALRPQRVLVQPEHHGPVQAVPASAAAGEAAVVASAVERPAAERLPAAPAAILVLSGNSAGFWSSSVSPSGSITLQHSSGPGHGQAWCTAAEGPGSPAPYSPQRHTAITPQSPNSQAVQGKVPAGLMGRPRQQGEGRAAQPQLQPQLQSPQLQSPPPHLQGTVGAVTSTLAPCSCSRRWRKTCSRGGAGQERERRALCDPS